MNPLQDLTTLCLSSNETVKRAADATIRALEVAQSTQDEAYWPAFFNAAVRDLTALEIAIAEVSTALKENQRLIRKPGALIIAVVKQKTKERSQKL